MSYHDIYLKYKDIPQDELFGAFSSLSIGTAMAEPRQDPQLFRALLSLSAEAYLEEMARRAHSLTVGHFGCAMQLYTPMYVSNYCENQCAYCGFNFRNAVKRRKLSLDDVAKEAAYISSTGLRHILLLTGESRAHSPLSYIKDCVKVLKGYFSSISVEIYALTESEYAELAHEGVDGVTLYQETYDEHVYGAVHAAGPKKDYRFRLDAPERAARGGIRNVNIGVLLGLHEWRKDVFLLGLHAAYLQDAFPGVDIGVSVPRLRPHEGSGGVTACISDRNMVQIITALRIFLPRLGLSLSTRESPRLRESLLPLGITRLSAGSSTKVGGHTTAEEDGANTPQFEISDQRSVEEIKAMLAAKGYQPVMKDWMLL